MIKGNVIDDNTKDGKAKDSNARDVKKKDNNEKDNKKNAINVNDKGFTLIELVIVIAILTFVLLVILTFQISGAKAFGREATTANNQLSVRRISNEIGRELRRASTASENSGQLTLTYPDGKKTVFYLDGSTIKAKYYYIDPYGALQLDHTGNMTQGIKRFNVTVLTGKVSIVIESLENSEGITYKLETEITIRK